VTHLGTIHKHDLARLSGEVSASFSAYPAVPGLFRVTFRHWTTGGPTGHLQRINRLRCLLRGLGFTIKQVDLWPDYVNFDVTLPRWPAALPTLGGLK
jgi:hypothetical protein